MRINEQETRLTLQEHDDGEDDQDDYPRAEFKHNIKVILNNYVTDPTMETQTR